MLLAVRWCIVITTTWGQDFHILSGVGEAGRGGRVVRTIAWPRGRLARCKPRRARPSPRVHPTGRQAEGVSTGHPNAHSSSDHSSKDVEATQVSIHRETLKKMCVCSGASNSLWPPGPSTQGIFQAKNTTVGYYFLHQGIVPTWGSNPCLLCLLHWQEDSFF